jgi:hypothetical protein
MSRQLTEIQGIVGQLIVEHQKLLAQMETAHIAMKATDLNAMDAILNQQEATRLRIAGFESRRKALALQVGQSFKISGDLTITKLAELFPQHRLQLIKQRDELRGVMAKISQRSYVTASVSTAVLGHLNLVLRLLAGAIERAGLYTRDGLPRMASRIGIIDARG